MSEARDKYKEVDPWKENNRAIFIDYIEELEHQITELKESQKQKRIIRLCERLDKAEQQKAELIEALSDERDKLYNNLPSGDIKAWDLLIVIKNHIANIDELLRKHTEGER